MIVKRKNNKKAVKKTSQNQRQAEPQRSLISKFAAAGIRGVGAAGGYMLGNGAAGYNFGANVSKFLGFGDYKINKNSLVRPGTAGIPYMHSSNLSTVIRHREYIADVIGNASNGVFKTTSFPINPGLQSSFPWLSAVAQQYQEYSFKGLVFEFISTSGDAVSSINPALGSVMMATQYRSTAVPFGSKQALLNEYYSTDAKTSECFMHAVECDPKENPFQVQYVRSEALVGGEDEKMYDLGTFVVATQGQQDTLPNVGELWCSYEVELKKPKLGLASGLAFAHYTVNGAIAPATPLGTSVSSAVDNIGLVFNIAALTITLPQGLSGNFLIQLVYGSNVTAITTMIFTIASPGTQFNICRGSNTATPAYTVGTGRTISNVYFQILPSTIPVVLTLNAPATLTGATQGDLYLYQISSTAN